MFQGIAQAALDTALNYAKNRIAFGKSLTRVPSVKVSRSSLFNIFPLFIQLFIFFFDLCVNKVTKMFLFNK